MIPVTFIRLEDGYAYADANMPAIPREDESVRFDGNDVYKVNEVIWEPEYSDGFGPDLGRVTIIIYKDS